MTKRKEPEEYVPEVRSETYVVSGPHDIHEVAPGGTIDLDPEDPETVRLLEGGHIATPPTTEDGQAEASPEIKE